MTMHAQSASLLWVINCDCAASPNYLFLLHRGKHQGIQSCSHITPTGFGMLPPSVCMALWTDVLSEGVTQIYRWVCLHLWWSFVWCLDSTSFTMTWLPTAKKQVYCSVSCSQFLHVIHWLISAEDWMQSHTLRKLPDSGWLWFKGSFCAKQMRCHALSPLYFIMWFRQRLNEN